MKIPGLEVHIVTTGTLEAAKREAADAARAELNEQHSQEMANYRQLTNKQLGLLLYENFRLRKTIAVNRGRKK